MNVWSASARTLGRRLNINPPAQNNNRHNMNPPRLQQASRFGGALKALISAILILGIINTIRGALEQLNQFLDSSPVQTESLSITDKGTYYRPLPIAFVAGTSRLVGSHVRVPMLSEAAENIAVGQKLDIVVGRGLFRKTWVFPADKHTEYNTLTFRVPYLGLFAGILAVFTFIYFRAVKRNKVSQRKSFGVFAGFLAVNIVIFYLT